MRKVKNRKVIRNLADKSFRANRTRNRIAVLAIALTTMLFTTVFTIGIGSVENFQQQTMRQSGSDSHGIIKNISREQYEKLRQDPSVKETADKIVVADEVMNAEFLKRHVEAWYFPPNYYSHAFVDIIDGAAPKSADEILLDEASLKLLGKEPKSGQQVELELKIRYSDETVIRRNFKVSGVIRSHPAMNVGFALVSSAYLDEYADELAYTYPENSSMTGAIQMEVNFSNSFRIQEKLNQVIENAGYSVNEEDADHIESNANWAYVSDGMTEDPITIGALLGSLLLIILTGYLIIYNIFQIAVIRDIRYYGLLKTVGTTGRQIKTLIRRQAVRMAVFGIPAGLIGGILVGNLIVPLVLGSSNFEGETVVTFHPLIFIGAALFALLTVWISTGRPARMAAKVSPIEAVRYTENGRKHKKQKKTTDGGKIWRMAFTNLGRSKRKTILVLCSMSLSIVLLNAVFTVTNSFDINKYLEKFVSSDFLIANAQYFNTKYYGPADDSILSEQLSESFISACEDLEGFEDGGRLYGSMVQVGLLKDSWKVPAHIKTDEYGNAMANFAGQWYPYSELDERNYQTAFYGMEDFYYQMLDVYKGENDPKVIRQKLESGKYLLASVYTDDNGQVETDQLKHQPGDRITLTYRDGQQKEFEILSLIKENHYGLTSRHYSSEFYYYTTAEIFKEMVSEQCLMSYAFDAQDKREAEIGKQLGEYTTAEEPLMSYESKQKWLEEYDGLIGLFLLVGGVLTLVIAVVGVLNFINSILTAIVARRREFAMLEAIGMTKRQLTNMLMLEGIYYALFTVMLSFTAGCLFSLTAVKSLSGGMWFMSYHFIVWPMLCVFPLLFVLGMIIPWLAYRFRQKHSMVEQLRTDE